MKPPADDIDDRFRIWDQLQYFWMDTDPEPLLPEIARVCAESKYSIAELEAIYWNEVRPAVAFNLRWNPVPEWTGFTRESLTARVLAKHRYGRPLPWRWLHREDRAWWERLAEATNRLR
jgi:hypothetical protein